MKLLLNKALPYASYYSFLLILMGKCAFQVCP